MRISCVGKKTFSRRETASHKTSFFAELEVVSCVAELVKMDIFTSDDVQRLLNNKFVVVIGDSIQRGVYKDLVYLLQNNKYMEFYHLKAKGEREFFHDELIEGGLLGEMTNGKSYREVRQYQTENYLIRYYFVTKCYNEYFETILLDFEQGEMPDVLIMNSCVWDITRYGPNGFEEYEQNIQRLFRRLQSCMPPTSLCLWLTALPIGSHVKGGFLLPELDFYNATLRFDVVICNFLANQVAVDYDFNVLDMHHHFRELTQWREKDGIHWNVWAHRRMSMLILTHICESWDVGVPNRNPYRLEWNQWNIQHRVFVNKKHKKINNVQVTVDENMNQVQRPNRVHERSMSCVSHFNHLTNTNMATVGSIPQQPCPPGESQQPVPPTVDSGTFQGNNMVLPVNVDPSMVQGLGEFQEFDAAGGPVRVRNVRLNPYNRR